MKISKLSQRLFNQIVREIRAEIANKEALNVAYCATFVVDEVLERHNIRSCTSNPDHLARIMRACGATYYKEPQGVVSLSADALKPVISDDWWLHDTTPANLENQPLALLTLAEKIGLDLAQMEWTGHYRPAHGTTVPWDNAKFLSGVEYQLRLGGIRCADDAHFMRIILNSGVVLTAHTGNRLHRLVVESLTVGDTSVSCKVLINTTTHRRREWRCGRAVGKLLVQMMHQMSKQRLDAKRAEGSSRVVRTPPNLGFKPQDLGLALTQGVYLEY